MGCCKSKDIISTILINSNEINISNFEFKENLKSKLSLIEEPNGFNCFVDFIFEIKTRGLYPINNNKLVSYNNNNLQLLFININRIYISAIMILTRSAKVCIKIKSLTYISHPLPCLTHGSGHAQILACNINIKNRDLLCLPWILGSLPRLFL